ncbi:hypothetical protein Q8F55_003280 [Vanrija albida]|uniref:Major facilitator superfamily (MFS) profile domain-containing protein n=1 Tax=Vanrija albida TaxID=181172 RepID=A0ABR3Q3J7_9TREE
MPGVDRQYGHDDRPEDSKSKTFWSRLIRSRPASAAPDERTPLLPDSPTSVDSVAIAKQRHSGPRLIEPIYLVYTSAFLLFMTYSFTQSSLTYSFRVFTCDAYYEEEGHEWDGVGDRCDAGPVLNRVAKSVSLMGALITGSMFFNLFLTTWFIDRFGIKAALFQQTIWGAFRNLCQIYAISIGGSKGIWIIQFTQLFNLLGGAGGSQLAANAYIDALSSEEERTGNFGRISGVFMLGSGIGSTIGGLAEQWGGLIRPFQCAFFLLVFCTVYGFLFLPYIPPAHGIRKPVSGSDSGDEEESEVKRPSMLAPLAVFIPRTVTITTPEGSTTTKKDYNVFLLGVGTFVSVLATWYVQTALQLISQNVFGFKPDASGFMITTTQLTRAFFLTVFFPRIIRWGRRWVASSDSAPPSETPTPRPSSPVPAAEHHVPPAAATRRRSSAALHSGFKRIPEHSGHPEHPELLEQAELPDPITGEPHVELELPDLPPTETKRLASAFDLYFLRGSILLDSILTGAVTFATERWHLYAAAFILPFASGTSPAARGVIMDFVGNDLRAEVLSGIALIEKIAQVVTISLFGVVLPLLADIERPMWIFAVDAAVAVVAWFILIPVQTPKRVQLGGGASA